MISSMHSEIQHKECEIVLSTDPIKELFEHAKQQYDTCRTNRTTAHRPVGARHPAFPAYWTKIANCHDRPMNTVVLDAKPKVDILSDMDEYLSPNAAA